IASSGCGAKAVLTTPPPGSTLTATTVSFGWTAGSGVSQYWLYVGTTGVGTSNIYNQSTGSAQSTTVSGLPSDGSTVYVRLWSLIAGGWQFNDYSYTSCTGCGGSQAAVMLSPTNGSTLNVTQTFTWTSGTGVSQYWLYVGTSPGGNNLYSDSQGTNHSVTLCCFPTDGLTIYVRLWSLISANWQFNDYV